MRDLTILAQLEAAARYAAANPPQQSRTPACHGAKKHTRQAAILAAFSADPKREWVKADVTAELIKRGFTAEPCKVLKLLDAMAIDLKIGKVRGCGKMRQPTFHHLTKKPSEEKITGHKAATPRSTKRHVLSLLT